MDAALVMDSGEGTERLGGFGIATRNFLVTSTTLGIARTWMREELEGGTANVKVEIGGKARSEDAICVIGETTATNEFDLHINADDPAKSWAWIKEHNTNIDLEDESTPERRLRKHIHGRLDRAPPTATLFFVEADREVGIKEGWVMECSIPMTALEQLTDDFLAEKASAVSIQVSWVGGLVRDSLAPSSIPTTWGLFKTDPDGSPESLWGHVESMSWQLKTFRMSVRDIVRQDD